MIKQISVLVENKVGALHEITRVLKENNIDIRAFSVFDTPYFGILRLLVQQTEKCEQLLRENGFGIKTTKVIGVELSNEIGALNHILEILSEGGFSVNYMYSMVLRANSKPLMVLDVKNMEQAEQLLCEKGVEVDDME